MNVQTVLQLLVPKCVPTLWDPTAVSVEKVMNWITMGWIVMVSVCIICVFSGVYANSVFSPGQICRAAHLF